MTLKGNARVSGSVDPSISNPKNGGGIALQNGAQLILKENAAILENYVWNRLVGFSAAKSKGGGVYVGALSAFDMQGGRITGNKVGAGSGGTNLYGGGVYVDTGGSFTMSGGIISGNSVEKAGTAPGPFKGGGVAVAAGGTFTKTGGVIYGQYAPSPELKNFATNNGHALWDNVLDTDLTF
jgi:hypothetical protein